MASPSSPELLVLHTVRLRSVTDRATVGTLTGLSQVQVAELLEGAKSDGLVRHRTGALSGWSLTPVGRERASELLAVELEVLEAGGGRAVVQECYERFRLLNPAVLEVCTAWQVRTDSEASPLVNDHTDSRYDREVIERLEPLHSQAVDLLAPVAGSLARFGRYAARLANALDHVRAGLGDWFTKPTIDSYHTVWFELHEDLLATLGLDRASEE